MSDGIIRVCREHDMVLRQLGAHLVCPHGHTCDVDWYVKPAATRVYPSLPLPVVEELIEPKAKEKRMSKPTTAAHKKGDPFPHGTHQRYFQEVKAGGEPPCDACRKAVAAYSKARREAREGAQPGGRATNPAKVHEPRAVQQKPRKIRALAARPKASRPRAVVAVVVPRAQGADLEGKVLRLRADLAEAEQAYLAHVQKLLPGLVLSR